MNSLNTSPQSSSSTLPSPPQAPVLSPSRSSSSSSSSSPPPATPVANTAELEDVPALPASPPTDEVAAPSTSNPPLAFERPKSPAPHQEELPLRARDISPPTAPRVSRLAAVAEEVVAALEARRRARALGDRNVGLGLNEDVLRGSMRVLDDIIQESAATNAVYNAERWRRGVA